MLQKRFVTSLTYATSFATVLLTSAAVAQTSTNGSIDTALGDGIDFRSLAFEACLAETSCTIGILNIHAERRLAGGTWVDAQIYWDPIDGFGVLGGRQNDEIDADERLTLTFDVPIRVAGMWLSDLFVGEGQRYHDGAFDVDDVETADIRFELGTAEVGSFSVNGVFELPEQPFETAFTSMFTKDGDLLNRLLVDETRVSLVMPKGETQTAVVLPLGQIDPAKQALFKANATQAIDIANLITSAGQVSAFEAGTSNADRILTIRDDFAQLAQLQALAKVQRRIGDAQNGELGWYPSQPGMVDKIILRADVQTSNDYSVAGLIVAGPFDGLIDIAELAK